MLVWHDKDRQGVEWWHKQIWDQATSTLFSKAQCGIVQCSVKHISYRSEMPLTCRESIKVPGQFYLWHVLSAAIGMLHPPSCMWLCSNKLNVWQLTWLTNINKLTQMPCSCPLQTFGQGREVAMYAPSEPVLDYNMVIIFLMAVGTVAIGGYWAGSKDIKK